MKKDDVKLIQKAKVDSAITIDNRTLKVVSNERILKEDDCDFCVFNKTKDCSVEFCSAKFRYDNLNVYLKEV